MGLWHSTKGWCENGKPFIYFLPRFQIAAENTNLLKFGQYNLKIITLNLEIFMSSQIVNFSNWWKLCIKIDFSKERPVFQSPGASDDWKVAPLRLDRKRWQFWKKVAGECLCVCGLMHGSSCTLNSSNRVCYVAAIYCHACGGGVVVVEIKNGLVTIRCRCHRWQRVLYKGGRRGRI